MSTTAQKIDLIHWITELKDASILNILKIIKEQSEKGDWWETISDEEKASIERGLDDVKKGKLVSHSKVMKTYEKWLKD